MKTKRKYKFPPPSEITYIAHAMTADLYDTDILLWAEAQADALRRRSPNALDWDNLAEEIEAVGRSQLHAVQSHIIQALLHDLKAEAWPLSRDADHWRAEARGHRSDARRQYTPSMRQRLDMAALYRDALRRMPDTLDGTRPLPVEVAYKDYDKVLNTTRSERYEAAMGALAKKYPDDREAAIFYALVLQPGFK
jgi:Domain of unknown function DUF29